MSEHDYPPNQGQSSDDTVDLTDEDMAAGEEVAAASNVEPGEARSSDEVAVLNDRILRLAAELENTRRRAGREKTDAGRYSIANFARDLLNVTDNFERALRAAGVSGEEIPEGRSDAFMGLVEGIKMTEKELLTVLERHGVSRINPEGEKFDPNLHQAVAQIPGGKIPAGHVVDVAQPGYKIGDRVLRAAMVTVSSGLSPSHDGGASEPGDNIDTEA